MSKTIKVSSLLDTICFVITSLCICVKEAVLSVILNIENTLYAKELKYGLLYSGKELCQGLKFKLAHSGVHNQLQVICITVDYSCC